MALHPASRHCGLIEWYIVTILPKSIKLYIILEGPLRGLVISAG